MKVLVHNKLAQDPRVIPTVRAYLAGHGLPPGCPFVVQKAGVVLVVKPATLKGISLFSPNGANYREFII